MADAVNFADYYEEDVEEVEVSEIVQYPWPCPDNWPLPSNHYTRDSQELSVPSSRSSTELSEEDIIDGYAEPATLEQVVHVVPVRPTNAARRSSTAKHSYTDDDAAEEIFFWGSRTKVQTVVEEEEIAVGPKSHPLGHVESAYFPDLKRPILKSTYASSLSGRSFNSTNSTRRKKRTSLLESYNRQHSKAGSAEEIEERRLHFPAEFKSRRIVEPGLKPWKDEPDRGLMFVTLIPLIGVLVGLIAGGYLIYTGYKGVPQHNFCMTLNETWANGIDPNVWIREVNLGGFGTGEFEWATDSDNNSFVQDGKLYIRPTLTSDVIGEDAVLDDYTVDLTLDGTCTGTVMSDCVATSNSTTRTVIPPVQSARLISKGKFNMKYGKIEIEARMPAGDWLWPALWMLPEDNVYGAWPLSGEIDIAESRGNDINYAPGGRNIVSSTLHWGPSTVLDAFFRTTNPNTQYHSTFASGFNTFGLEWTDKYLYTYVNNHLRQVFYLKFEESFFSRGLWPAIDATNKTAITNPWAAANNDIAPFDQKFYLIMNVAVGTSFGFFPDGVGNKPWVDGTATAMADFYADKDTWYPTWGKGNDRAMVIESVKAWDICG